MNKRIICIVLSALMMLALTGCTYLWDPRCKGLDDYIWESLLHKQRAN